MSDDDPLLKKARMAQEKARRSSHVETPRSFIEEQADKVNRKITFWRRLFSGFWRNLEHIFQTGCTHSEPVGPRILASLQGDLHQSVFYKGRRIQQETRCSGSGRFDAFYGRRRLPDDCLGHSVHDENAIRCHRY
jgi:hypothetical protein